MIIRYPTASYLSILPQTESDGGNVTFTISMEQPPRSTLVVSQLPAAIERRIRSAIVNTQPDGQRVYTVTRSNAAAIGSAKKQFEVGQVLEFAEGQLSTIQPMLVSDSLEIRHDTNMLDFAALGISQDEGDYISGLASSQFADLNSELNSLRQARIDTETAIVENQKSQNEVKKAIAALEQLVSADSSLQQTIEALQDKLAVLVVEAGALVASANDQASNASEVSDRILAVAQMVR